MAIPFADYLKAAAGPSDCILLLSGGVDSTTVLAALRAEGRHPLCLIFDYGQSLVKECQVAIANAWRYDCKSHLVRLDLRWTTDKCSLLQPHQEIATGRTPAEITAGGTPSSYVPFRNGVFLSLAVAYGEGHNLSRIYCGGNGLNSGNYWDDTQEFAAAFGMAAKIGTAPTYRPHIIFPLTGVTKAQVVYLGRRLHVDYSLTWSCYKNGPIHCGQCDSCVQRREAGVL